MAGIENNTRLATKIDGAVEQTVRLNRRFRETDGRFSRQVSGVHAADVEMEVVFDRVCMLQPFSPSQVW